MVDNIKGLRLVPDDPNSIEETGIFDISQERRDGDIGIQSSDDSDILIAEHTAAHNRNANSMTCSTKTFDSSLPLF